MNSYKATNWQPGADQVSSVLTYVLVCSKERHNNNNGYQSGIFTLVKELPKGHIILKCNAIEQNKSEFGQIQLSFFWLMYTSFEKLCSHGLHLQYVTPHTKASRYYCFECCCGVQWWKSNAGFRLICRLLHCRVITTCRFRLTALSSHIALA